MGSLRACPNSSIGAMDSAAKEERGSPGSSTASDNTIQYQKPAIIWEQEFVALATVSSPPCIPGVDPACTP
jgi:hypothetical protein